MSVKHYCLYVFFAAVLFAPLSFGDSNVLINPGFETGDTSGWSPRGCPIQAVPSPVHSGDYSARAYDRTADWNGIEQGLMDITVEGQTYQISGWVLLENAPDANVHCVIKQTVDGGTTYNWVGNVVCNDSEWTQLAGSFTPNEQGGTLTALSVYFESDVGISFFVDDASVLGPEIAPPEPNATGEVDATVRHQIIEGFGAAGAWYENWLTNHSRSEEIYDLLFGDLGLDIYRIRNTYDYDSAYMNNTAVIVNAALQRNPDLKIMISSWSPPTYLKSTGQLNSGTLAGGPDNYVYDDFAQWWYESIGAWSSYGIDADYISIQNEPDYNGNDRCLFDPTENATYAGYDQALETVWQKLNTEMGSSMPKMIGPETSGFNGASGYSLNDYLSAIIDHSHIYAYAHHLYNCNNGGPPGCGDAPDMYLGNMINLNSTWGSKPLMQTEYEHATNYWPDALNMALLLHNSLTVEEVAAYLYWDLFWNNGGLITVDNPWQSDGYTVNSDYYGFKHFSAFIFPGWQRVEASADNSSVRISAYISPDSQNLTCVLINTADDTDIETDLALDGFLVGQGEIYRTSPTENCEYVGSYDGTGPLILPAESVTTLSLLANTPPVADAGPDQTAFAFIYGWADVNMDGSGSYDDDGDSLDYYWSWNIGGTDYDATNVSPTTQIQLPVGVHTIKLVVDDGIAESQPDYCTVNVIAPVEARLLCKPIVLTPKAKHGRVSVKISMPLGIHKSHVDKTERPAMYIGSHKIESLRQSVRGSRRHKQPYTRIVTSFSKPLCAEQLDWGDNKIIVAGKFKSGQYYKATGHLWLVEKRRDLRGRVYRSLKQMYKRWFKWKSDDF